MVAFPQWPEPLRDLALERQRRSLTQGSFHEGERNDGLFKLGSSSRGAGKSKAEVLDLLLTENEVRCSPPLERSEVEQIAHSVAKYPLGASVSLPSPSLPLRGGSEGRRLVYQSMPLEELLDQVDDVEWLIDGILPKGGVLLVTGEPGGGKSWMLQELALAFTTGRPWLGHFPTTKADVLVIDEENALRLLKKRLERLGAR